MQDPGRPHSGCRITFYKILWHTFIVLWGERGEGVFVLLRRCYTRTRSKRLRTSVPVRSVRTEPREMSIQNQHQYQRPGGCILQEKRKENRKQMGKERNALQLPSSLFLSELTCPPFPIPPSPSPVTSPTSPQGGPI